MCRTCFSQYQSSSAEPGVTRRWDAHSLQTLASWMNFEMTTGWSCETATASPRYASRSAWLYATFIAAPVCEREEGRKEGEREEGGGEEGREIRREGGRREEGGSKEGGRKRENPQNKYGGYTLVP